jgi:hypothetical protein
MRAVPDISFARRAWFAAIVCVILTIPFWFVTIPPLTDVPGHMGAAAAAAYAPADPAFARLMGYHWFLVPNLGGDLIVAALRHAVGITRAYWIVAALIPPLLAIGMLMIARILNPRGAAAIAWALMFIYCYPFSYGFINYMLGVACALIGFACWMKLDARPRLREAAAWLAVPLLFLCHVVAGCLFVLFVAAREFDLTRGQGLSRTHLAALLRRTRPLLSSVVILLLWRLSAHSFAGHNTFSLKAKGNALLMLLRDQNIVLDVGTLILALLVFVIGWARGARPHRAVMPALLGLIVLFLITPFSLSGSAFADSRLLPLLPMLAFATQDWSRAGARLTRIVAISGLALLGARLAATTLGFIGYQARYTTELAALDHVPQHSRLVVLDGLGCKTWGHWRADRLGHIADLAIVYRRSWTNSEWDVDGAHLLQIRYRPSDLFYHDPSQYVWPLKCGGNQKKDHPSISTALARVPFGGIDYLWLIDIALPPGYTNPRLTALWNSNTSTLYAVAPSDRSGQGQALGPSEPPTGRSAQR